MSGRHWMYVDDIRIETCDCDAGRDHLDDGTPVLSPSPWMLDHILFMAYEPAVHARIFDYRGGPPP